MALTFSPGTPTARSSWPSLSKSPVTEVPFPPATGAHLENSEVFPPGSWAVDVRNCPGATGGLNVAVAGTLPPAPVVTDVDATRACPSPLPEGSQEVLANSSRLKDVDGVLFRDVATVVAPPADVPGPSTG